MGTSDIHSAEHPRFDVHVLESLDAGRYVLICISPASHGPAKKVRHGLDLLDLHLAAAYNPETERLGSLQ
jgi:hypothetical protein